MNSSDSSACTPDVAGWEGEGELRSGIRADEPLASFSIGGKGIFSFSVKRVPLAIKMKLGNTYQGLGSPPPGGEEGGGFVRESQE